MYYFALRRLRSIKQSIIIISIPIQIPIVILFCPVECIYICIYICMYTYIQVTVCGHIHFFMPLVLVYFRLWSQRDHSLCCHFLKNSQGTLCFFLEPC